MDLGHFKASSGISGIHSKLAMEFQVDYFNQTKAKQKTKTKTNKKAQGYCTISDSIPQIYKKFPCYLQSLCVISESQYVSKWQLFEEDLIPL